MTESKAVILRDRKIVTVSGTDRVKFLQGLMTNDIRRLAPDRTLYAGFLTGQGKLLCDAFVMQDGGRILIDIAGAHVGDFIRRLNAFKLREAVEIGETAPTLAVAAVWGTGAAARLELDSAEGATGNSALADAHLAFVDPRIAALGRGWFMRRTFPLRPSSPGLVLPSPRRRIMPGTDSSSVLPTLPERRAAPRSAVEEKRLCHFIVSIALNVTRLSNC